MNEQVDDRPTVHQAIIAVMKGIDHVGKDGGGGKLGYKFRGIDAVINAVGPQFRAAGVFVVPDVLKYDYQTTKSNAGNEMASVRLTVSYQFFGPRGDSLSAIVVGEAFDSGDKATAKAMSVALRTCLLQVLALPTDEPDPDTQVYERGGGAVDTGARAADLGRWTGEVKAAGHDKAKLGALWQRMVAEWDAVAWSTERQAIIQPSVDAMKAAEGQQPAQQSAVNESVMVAEEVGADKAGEDFLAELGQAEHARDLLVVRQLIAKANSMKRPDLRRQATDSLNGLKELAKAEAEG